MSENDDVVGELYMAYRNLEEQFKLLQEQNIRLKNEIERLSQERKDDIEELNYAYFAPF
jgi:hypothetical protein